jgi:hypothetical protein
LYVVRLKFYTNKFEQMPCKTMDGLPIVYIDPYTKMVDEEYDENVFEQYKEAKQCEWEFVQAIIDEKYEDLFVNHSNLVAINAENVNGQVVVKFTVICKGYIPYEESVLPKILCGAKTIIVEGWFSYCTKISPGCDIAPICRCYLEDYEKMENETSCTFGSIGGFVRTGSKMYVVTAGHVFEGCELNTPVMHSTALQQLYKYLKSHGVSSSDFDALKERFGFKVGLEKACNFAEKSIQGLQEYVNCEKNIQKFGDLVVFTTGMPKITLNELDCSVDVALIEVNVSNIEIDITDTFIKYMCLTTGNKINTPQMILTVKDGKIEQDNIFDVLNSIVDNEIEVHGVGARTSIDLYLKLRPTHKAYVRKWSKKTNTEPIFDTYHASSFAHNKNISIQPGDSGMWFWTEDKVVGMGIGYLQGNQQTKSIILPMKNVARAIEVMLDI